MRARHPLPIPRRWLMTDERMGDALWSALERLPRGGGIVFRHYGLPLAERRALFARVAAVARRRRLVLIRAGKDRLGRHEDGVHGRHLPRGPGLRTWPAHHRRDIVAGRRAHADVIFLSPIYPTRSHPGGRPLGIVRAAALGREIAVPLIALGGITPRKSGQLHGAGFDGWAAIDAWMLPEGRDQKRIAVPI